MNREKVSVRKEIQRNEMKIDEDKADVRNTRKSRKIRKRYIVQKRYVAKMRRREAKKKEKRKIM